MTTSPALTSLPPPIVASAADLPPAVAAILELDVAPESGVVESGGIPFATRAWGDPAAAPILLIHGVTASSRIWWRVGPALATGLERRVVAVDQPGHGRTGHWTGHHRFADNAADLARFIATAGLARADLSIVGHSWGGMTAACLPGAGLRPAVLVLLDPPAIPAAAIATMLEDPNQHSYENVNEAITDLGDLHRTWPYGDVVAKAEALTQFDEPAVRSILTGNGDWDGGLAALLDPAAAGGLIPDDMAARLAARVGAGNVLTIAGGSHAPMRTRIEATILALMRALRPR